MMEFRLEYRNFEIQVGISEKGVTSMPLYPVASANGYYSYNVL